tara:strand:+ start:1669 stop:1845 length:177 start_codon:yes stop_codon:yes gene_type:complete
MNITSAQYETDEIKEGNTGIIAVIDGVTMGVPIDTANRHYAEIMRQVDEGSLTIAEAE